MILRVLKGKLITNVLCVKRNQLSHIYVIYSLCTEQYVLFAYSPIRIDELAGHYRIGRPKARGRFRADAGIALFTCPALWHKHEP